MLAARGLTAWVRARLEEPQWSAEGAGDNEAVTWATLGLTRVNALVNAPIEAGADKGGVKAVGAVQAGVNKPEAWAACDALKRAIDLACASRWAKR